MNATVILDLQLRLGEGWGGAWLAYYPRGGENAVRDGKF